MSSTQRFGFEWDKYSQIDNNYEAQFKNWTYPLQPADFVGKKVLDAGCGMGRNSYWALKWGAASLVAFDFDQRSVSAAKKNLEQFKNCDVQFKSIYNINWQNQFDLVFSVGVIHHLKDPRLALAKLIDALIPGGALLIWVYSLEGNEWVVKYVNPIRRHFTAKLPLRLVHALSYFCSIPLWLFVKVFKGPSEYLNQLSGFKFYHIHSIVFDQLIPDVANYWSQAELAEIFKKLNLSQFEIHQPPNKCGWVVIGKK